MPEDRLPEDEATYYPPERPRLRPGVDVEWEAAITAGINWLDEFDQQSEAPEPLDTATLAGSAHEVIRRLIAAIRERGL